MVFKVFLTKKSERELDKLGRSDARQVLKRFLIITFPFPKNYDIDKFSGLENSYRLRVGRVRVIMEVDRKRCEIWIRKVGYRGGIYK